LVFISTQTQGTYVPFRPPETPPLLEKQLDVISGEPTQGTYSSLKKIIKKNKNIKRFYYYIIIIITKI